MSHLSGSYGASRTLLSLMRVSSPSSSISGAAREDLYECIYCSEIMPQKDKAMHQGFLCRVLIENSGINLSGVNEEGGLGTECSEDVKYEVERNENVAMDIVEVPAAIEPEVVELWDSKKVEGLDLVTKGTQTEDLPPVFNEQTEHELLEAKSISKLTKNLGGLLLQGPDHDVTIKVKNRPFKAHKAVLSARSPVFASMFRDDMEANASGAFSIDDCDPDVFGQFLKHVYTGAFEMDSVKSAVALYYVADKYDFQELKEACVGYLCRSFATTTVCDVIMMATVHGEKGLLQRASLFFKRNLDEILKTVEWQIFLQSNTIIANELLIEAVNEPVGVQCPSCSMKRT